MRLLCGLFQDSAVFGARLRFLHAQAIVAVAPALERNSSLRRALQGLPAVFYHYHIRCPLFWSGISVQFLSITNRDSTPHPRPDYRDQIGGELTIPLHAPRWKHVTNRSQPSVQHLQAASSRVKLENAGASFELPLRKDFTWDLRGD